MVGFGTALAGYGNAQPQIQALIQQEQQKQQQKQQQAALFKAIQQAQQSGQPPQMPPVAPPPNPNTQAPPMPPQMPPGMQGPPMPPSLQTGGPQPAGNPSPTPQGLPGGSPMANFPMPPSPQSNMPQAFGAGLPNMSAMIQQIASMDIPADQKMTILEEYGAFANPMEKLQQQLEIKQTQMQSQQQMLDQKLQELRDLAVMRDQRSGSNTDKNNTTRKEIADTNRQEKYDQMSSIDLRAELTSVTNRLDTDPKLSSEERKTLQEQWAEAKKALDDKRKAEGLPPSKEKAPKSATKEAPAAGTVHVIDPNGVPGTIPADQLDDALKAGYKKAS
jgi:hypothetical protein